MFPHSTFGFSLYRDHWDDGQITSFIRVCPASFASRYRTIDRMEVSRNRNDPTTFRATSDWFSVQITAHLYPLSLFGLVRNPVRRANVPEPKRMISVSTRSIGRLILPHL